MRSEKWGRSRPQRELLTHLVLVRAQTMSGLAVASSRLASIVVRLVIRGWGATPHSGKAAMSNCCGQT
jgi:hypothetical protein